MGRFISLIPGILALSLFLPGCSRELVEKPVNPRLAKSGKKLIEEEGIPVASDSSESIPDEDKRLGNITAGDAKAVALSAAREAPALNRVQMAQLVQRARSGNANAQVDLGNVFFEGKGVPVNKQAAEHWWQMAAAKRHPMAEENLQMLHTKPEEGVSFFGTKSKGSRFVFVIDKSGSMGGHNKFGKAKRELIKTLRALPQNACFMIYFFDGGAEKLPANNMLAATPKNVSWAEDWVKSRGMGGGTDPCEALKSGFNLKPDTVWLLTDGQFNDEAGALGVIRRGNSKKSVRINTFAFMDRVGERVLKQIAQENDGTYRFVQN
jgi:Mg-chelatase subunit ChlD